MKPLLFKKTILAIGAHPDDIELGCGGFINRLRNEQKCSIHFAVMTPGMSMQNPTGETPDRYAESRKAAEALLGLNPGDVDCFVHPGNFVDRELELASRGMIGFIENLLESLEPSVILTHARPDLHADHRQVHEATLSAARSFAGSILFYQAPSTIPNEFKPNYFVVLGPDSLSAKQTAIAAHVSQRSKDFISYDRIAGMARSWALFHRAKFENLEAFELYQTYWKAD